MCVYYIPRCFLSRCRPRKVRLSSPHKRQSLLWGPLNFNLFPTHMSSEIKVFACGKNACTPIPIGGKRLCLLWGPPFIFTYLLRRSPVAQTQSCTAQSAAASGIGRSCPAPRRKTLLRTNKSPSNLPFFLANRFSFAKEKWCNAFLLLQAGLHPSSNMMLFLYRPFCHDCRLIPRD